MIPKSGYQFPACAKPWLPVAVPFDASAGEQVGNDHAQKRAKAK
jgi:hypothetical protein